MSLALRVDRLALDGRILISRLDILVPAGSIHTVMGASGSGKSSLLAAVCGTLDAAFDFEGEIQLHGRRIDQLAIQARHVGILFQDDLLFAHMSVKENLLFAVPAGPAAARDAAVTQALADAQLQGMADADPSTLSGGQRARVALMRALLAQPRALLLDEPFSRLDSGLRERMRTFVFSTLQRRKMPALLVTHDAQDIADSQRLTRL